MIHRAKFLCLNKITNFKISHRLSPLHFSSKHNNVQYTFSSIFSSKVSLLKPINSYQ
nr:MAG TPA: hypothetical protein [Caudoviricetes sp.]